MAAAIGPGGAEMGQRSARVTGTAAAGPGTASKSLTTEAVATEDTWKPTFGIQGLDVSGHQPSVDWQQQWDMGARFAYVKATEGNYFSSETFASQYQGSRSIGMVRGAYHFAIPNWSSGADQARYFVQNGGGWSADGYTLPPVLDFEFNPYAGRTINGFYFGNSCYDMSPAQLTSWVRDFGNTMVSLTGRLPVIYTNTSWWKQCTADAPGFGDYPLWVASYPLAPSNNVGPIPSSWSNFSIWQYSSTGPFTGDSNVWNGDYAGLKRYAAGYGVTGGIASAWAAAGGGGGKLGYPTSNEICGLTGGGCYQRFQGGTIHWSPASGASATWGAIGTTWGTLGYENGKLGYPVTNEICGLTGGGCYQRFQGGTIHWSPATGASATWGAIRATWASLGSEKSKLGYPIGKETCGLTGGGCYQRFQGGTIHWSPASGAFATWGGIRATWAGLGSEKSKLGYPTGKEICGLTGGGCYQTFQGGTMHWSPATRAFATWGGIRATWGALGYEKGKLGYPVTNEICGLTGGGCYQTFRGGTIHWSPATGARATWGGIRATWGALGYEKSKLGYPITNEICGLTGGGCYQGFQGGTVHWSPTTGAHATWGAIRATWGALGYEKSRLGYPVTNEICGLANGGCVQNFRGGTISRTDAAGIKVSYK
ncbi:GH25 family lysozyme [Arthrobacter sp. NPDC056886]|uniref:GH25 family lysozyme n=1 Tax=Arthrobacter sp. NPDC056886 TaxID=3345960 RepID=UPI00366A8764